MNLFNQKNCLSTFLFLLSIFLFTQCQDDETYCPAKPYRYRNLKNSLTSEKPENKKWKSFHRKTMVKNEPYASYDNTLTFDLYGPDAISNEKKPLIIFVHSGGFMLGNKENFLMGELCRDFARAGFYTAKINYRLIDFSKLEAVSMLVSKNYVRRSIFNSLVDLREAVKYFKENGEKWGIDTDQIYVAGYSSGAILALHLAFTDEQDLKGCSYFGNVINYNNGVCLDCMENDLTSNSSLDVDSAVKGIISISGAVFNKDHIDGDDLIPLLLIHGVDDDIVPIGNDQSFKKFITEYKFDVPGLYYELGVSRKKGDHEENWTIGGLKISLQLPEWMSKIIVNNLTPIMHGPQQICHDVEHEISRVEIKGAGHVFFKGENGTVNKAYDVIRNEIKRFIQNTTRNNGNEMVNKKKKRKRSRRENRRRNNE